MGFLDENGLAHFWEKVKAAIDAKLPGGSGGEIYSTEEQRIGTWIDGKPLYKKTYTGSTNFSAGGTTPTLPLDPNFEVQSYECRMNYSTLRGVFMNSCAQGDWWVNSTIYPTGAGYGHTPGLYIQFSQAVSGYANPLGFILTIKYTKTTDPAAAEL